LRDVSQASSGVAPAIDAIDVVLKDISTALGKIIADTTKAADPNGELTAKKLAIVLPPDQVDQALALIAGASAKTPTEQEAIIDQGLSPKCPHPNIAEAPY
jgi:hypothetical protein